MTSARLPPPAPAAGAGAAPDPSLVAALAGRAGLTVRAGEPLAGHTTFRIGGPAELFVEVTTEAALQHLVVELARRRVPLLLLGLGSNLLVPDDGLPGVVARLGGELARLSVEGERVEVGAALPLARVARQTASQGLVGLEALSGFPSTVGGAVVMNAGCYGTEIKDVLESASVVERDGSRRTLAVEQLGAGYRRTVLQGSGAIVTGAVLRLRRGDAAAALARIDELNRRRRESLPSGVGNAGSVFRNPPGDYAGRLIEACGLKGQRHGGARISPKHANVIVNEGGALATDVLALMVAARRAVAATFGVALEPEVVLCGGLAARWRAEAAGDEGAGRP